jgi:carbamate kinase
MRLVVALGGNAMIAADGTATPEAQRAAVAVAMQPVADLIASGHEVVLTHGNGPQVGNLLVKNALAAQVVPPVPLDWCGAQTQATIGFTILDELEAALAARGAARPLAALVSRTRVDPDDPGFARPTKPVGRYLPREQAQLLVDHGEQWEDRGAKGWRRVVASPEPLEVLETSTVLTLLAAGHVVVAAGGGGIPVVRQSDGTLRGVEAVIDKDLTATLLAQAVEADALVIATDVEHVAIGWGTPGERPLGVISPDELERYAAHGEFASGSMGPKVEAALRFVRSGGHRAVITDLHRIADALAGDSGAAGRVGTIIESPDNER